MPEKESLPEMDIEIQEGLSSREKLTVYTLARLFRADTWPEEFAAMASAYLLHTAFLNQLALEERHFPAPSQALEEVRKSSKVDEFLNRFYAEATKILETNAISFNETVQLCDCVDGRLLLKLLAQKVDIPDAVAADFERLAEEVKKGATKDVGLSTSSFAPQDAEAAVSMLQTERKEPIITPVLPFSNPQFDQHLNTVTIDVEVVDLDNEFDEEVADSQYRPVKFKKTAKEAEADAAPANGGYRVQKKPMLNKGGRFSMVDKAEKRALGKMRRKDQIDMAQMQRYAASLTDSVDGSLNQKLIICDDAKEVKKQAARPTKVLPVKGGKKEKEEEPAAPANNKPGKPVKGGKKEAPAAKEVKGGKKEVAKKAPVLSKADKIKLENAEKAVAKEAKALSTSWKNLCNELKVTRDEDVIINRLDDHLKKLAKDVPKNASDEHEGRFIEVEVRLYKISALQKQWISFCTAGQKEKGYNTVAVLFDEARKALQIPALTVAVKTIIQNVFAGLGIALPPSKPVVAAKRAVSFAATWTGKVEGVDTKLGMTSEEFQLLHFGPYMDRNMGSAPDDRVPFEPDRWQREVLDEIDANNSVFVVAPTSAGKTFISFHAMEKILKADDTSVLVYIAPTKALVNQIAAEIISRFRKNYRHAGKSVWAVDNGDFFMNKPEECQILITVPSVLSTMLMSPERAKNWAPRVKRIIFDEIHSIGNAEDGVVWEQLCLLAPCPIIALSATVGNPDEFSDWLATAQKSLGVKLNKIVHPYRYSDLRKFIYRPAKEVGAGRFAGLPKLTKFGQIDTSSSSGLEPIHPISALVDPTNGMPDDLALEPADCLTLYRAMKKAETPEFTVPEELDYGKFFGTTGVVIKKADTVVWEDKLKTVLKSWMQQADKSPFSKVVELLGPKADDPTDETEIIAEAAQGLKSNTTEDQTQDPAIVYDHGDVPTLLHLKKKTLPLLASLHAANALPALMFSYDRAICEYICENLASQLKEAETHYRETDPRWAKKIKEWETYMERKKKMGNKMRKVKPDEGLTKLDMARDQGEAEASVLDSFNPEDPLPEFSFADFKRYSKSDYESDLKTFEKWEVPEILVEAFKRGIGVHHSGLPRRYRQAVETLFRKGYFRIIISEGTLAMGINMPCKTVIFAGDSTHLTPLQYRQAAGRAGRRGFDLLGNVIFHAFPLDSTKRLISSRLPKLQGHFPMSTSLVLRLCTLLSNSKDVDFAKNTIDTLLRQPRLVIGGDSFREQVLHHLRFSLEYLRRKKLLGPTGSPLNFAAMTGHLYYTEQAAMALHALLVDGYLGRMCRDFTQADTRMKEQICEDFMLVLSHLFVRRTVPRGRHGIRTLPPLPQEPRKVLQDWNADTLQTYSTYVATFAKAYCAEERDNKLPFSGVAAGGTGVAPGQTHPANARSSFVALSGHSDEFQSIQDLATSLRSGVFFEASAVPYLDLDVQLNSFLYDFYKHGDVTKLANENWIAPSEVWYVLKDFSTVLATFRAGLVNWIRQGSGAYFEVKKGQEEGKDEDAAAAEEPPATLEGEDDEGEDGEKGDWEQEERAEEGRCVLRVLKEVQERYEVRFKSMWA
jgi:superfamily II RNA helicase